MTIWRTAAARTGGGAIIAAAMLGLGIADAQAQDDTWFARDVATGDWDGARQWLAEAGVTPQAKYTTNLLANPVGGARQGFAYAGNLDTSLDFDLERLLGLKGSSFFIAASWASVVSRSWWKLVEAALGPGWHGGVDQAARSRSVGERSRLGQPSTRRKVI